MATPISKSSLSPITAKIWQFPSPSFCPPWNTIVSSSLSPLFPPPSVALPFSLFLITHHPFSFLPGERTPHSHSDTNHHHSAGWYIFIQIFFLFNGGKGGCLSRENSVRSQIPASKRYYFCLDQSWFKSSCPNITFAQSSVTFKTAWLTDSRGKKVGLLGWDWLGSLKCSSCFYIYIYIYSAVAWIVFDWLYGQMIDSLFVFYWELFSWGDF